MKSILTQKQAQPLQKLSFCYLCGQDFNPSSVIDREHIVAKNLFHLNDRNFPIILPSHKACNNAVSEDDETIGQLVQLLHSAEPKSHKIKLTGFYKDDELKAGTVQGIAFERVIWRWVRGFHAALYGSPLMDVPETYAILAPLPEVTENKGRISRLPIREQYYKISEVVRRNRDTNNLDVIECYNGKLRYETVWDKSDDGKPICFFALKIYDWSDLGANSGGPRQGCLGAYLLDYIPPQASMGTPLHFSPEGGKTLDPFHN